MYLTVLVNALFDIIRKNFAFFYSFDWNHYILICVLCSMFIRILRSPPFTTSHYQWPVFQLFSSQFLFFSLLLFFVRKSIAYANDNLFDVENSIKSEWEIKIGKKFERENESLFVRIG